MSSTNPFELLSRHALRTIVSACWLAGGAFFGTSAFAAADHPKGTAVFSTVSPHYKRVRLADGSFQPETFAFGNGGCTAGQSRDESIDDLPFLAVAAELVDPLARSGYVACREPGKTQLLLMVHWGTTRGVSDIELAQSDNGPRAVVSPFTPPCTRVGATNQRCAVTLSPGFDREQLAASGGTAAMGFENRVREQLLHRNAQILGFTDELRRIDAVWWQPGMRDSRGDILGDLEESRYFVILVAYDFQKAWRSKTLDVLWTTRFSLRTRSNRFDEQLPALASQASRYFGADSHGLVRGSRARVGTVTIGPAEVMDHD